MIQRFGTTIQEDWGWASPYLPNTPPRPHFSAIEQSVGADSWQLHVGMANHSVHGGFKGMVTDLGAGGNRYSDIILSGPSRHGLVVPADATLLTLYKCTLTFLLHEPADQSHVQAAALTIEMKKARGKFIETESRLVRENRSDNQNPR